MIRIIYNYILDTLAFIGGVFFQLGSRRFDNLSSDAEYKNKPFAGHSAIVVETLTKSQGAVRYGGVVWKAKLAMESTAVEIRPEVEVSILEVRGNLLIINAEYR